MGLLCPLQELPGLGLHGQNVFIAKNNCLHIVTTYEKLVVNYYCLLYICLPGYVSTSMRSAFSETLVLLADLAYVRRDSQKLSVVRNRINQ